jgi:hypothetical protein
MKKMIVLVAALLSMTATFAEDEKVNDVKNYDMSVNYTKLGEALGLSKDQKEEVADVHQAFCIDMLNAANAGKEERESMVNLAVKRDIMYMRLILNDKQYRKYLLLLNTTLNNRGLNK